MLSSSLPRVSGTDKGRNLPSRVLGHDHYIPNKKQLSNPPSEEKKILEDFKNLTKTTTVSPTWACFSQAPRHQGLQQGQPCATTFCWIKSTACLTGQLLSDEHQVSTKLLLTKSWCLLLPDTVNRLHTLKSQLFKIAVKSNVISGWAAKGSLSLFLLIKAISL